METTEVSNNDDIAARREARRRKILENSKSRLSRITGREHTDEDDKKTEIPGNECETQPKEQVIYPDPEVERDVYIPQSTPFPSELFGSVDGMGALNDHTQFFELFQTLQQQNAGQSNSNSFAAFAQFGSGDGGAGPNAFFGNMNAPEQPKVPETRLQKFLNTKIHIGLLAVLTYFFILLTPFHWNVFLVFLAWEIAEIFILRQHESNPNGMINVLFMFAGISPTKVNMVLKWVQLLNKILRDVALFMFFFVLIHVCRAYWTGLSIVPLIEQMTTINDHSPNVIDDMADDEFERFDL